MHQTFPLPRLSKSVSLESGIGLAPEKLITGKEKKNSSLEAKMPLFRMRSIGFVLMNSLKIPLTT